MGNKKTYHDWLFTRSKKEKELDKQLKKERKDFEKTPEYKAHKKRVNAIFNEMKVEAAKRREEARQHRPQRVRVNAEPIDMKEFKKVQVIKKAERMASYPEELRNLIEGYEKLGEAEKKVFDRETFVRLEHYPDYENPQTTEKDLCELLEILVQETIDFINERGLKDIDCISFGADSLQTSAKYGEWTPATDANVYALGMQNEKQENGKEYLVYKKIGDYM